MNKLMALLLIFLASVIVGHVSVARDYSTGPLGWDDMHPREKQVVVESTPEASPQPTSSVKADEK